MIMRSLQLSILLFLCSVWTCTSLSNADVYWYNDGTGLNVDGATVPKFTTFASQDIFSITEKLFIVGAGTQAQLFKYENGEILHVKSLGTGYYYFDVCDKYFMMGGVSGGFTMFELNLSGDDLTTVSEISAAIIKNMVTATGETWLTNDRGGGSFAGNDCSKIILGKTEPFGIRVFDFDTSAKTVTYAGPVDCGETNCPAASWSQAVNSLASSGNDIMSSSLVGHNGATMAGGVVVYQPNPSTGLHEVLQVIYNPDPSNYDWFGASVEGHENGFWVSSRFATGGTYHAHFFKLNPTTGLYELDGEVRFGFAELKNGKTFNSYNSLRVCAGSLDPKNQVSGSGTIEVWEKDNAGWAEAYSFNTDHATSTFPADIICGSDYVITANTYKDNYNSVSHGYIALYNLNPAPTPPPPPPACVTSPDCGNVNQYCTPSLECVSTPCLTNGVVDHTLCDGIFQPGRLPICHKNGFCRDTVESSCTNANKCSLARAKYLDNTNNVGKVDVKFGANLVPTKQRQAALQQIALAKQNSATTAELKAYVTASKEITLDGTYFDAVGDQQVALDAIKETVCGTSNVDFCTIQITGGTGIGGRRLDTEYSVTVTYEVDEATFASIESNTAIDDPLFLDALATAAGVDVANITVTASGGEITVTYVLVAESSDQAPLGDDVLQDIEDLETNLDSVTQTVISNLNITAADIESTTLNKCDGRDCNGFGATLCDSNTGQCNCPAGYWGINCDEVCSCENGGTCPMNMCHCPYPYFGAKCNSTKTDCSDGNCA